jgi:hypothetical protein
MQCLPEVAERSGKGRLVAWHTTTTTEEHAVGRHLSTAIPTLPREHEESEIGIAITRPRFSAHKIPRLFSTGVWKAWKDGKRQFRQLPWRWRARSDQNKVPISLTNSKLQHPSSRWGGESKRARRVDLYTLPLAQHVGAVVMVSECSPLLLGLDVLSRSATANLLYVSESRSLSPRLPCLPRVLAFWQFLSQAGDLLVCGCR